MPSTVHSRRAVAGSAVAWKVHPASSRAAHGQCTRVTPVCKRLHGKEDQEINGREICRRDSVCYLAPADWCQAAEWDLCCQIVSICGGSPKCGFGGKVYK